MRYNNGHKKAMIIKMFEGKYLNLVPTYRTTM